MRADTDEYGIDIVVVNWNSREDLAECLASLEGQTDRAFGVVVVDNGSVDGSVEMVRANFPWVTALATGENLGFAEGCNRGIAACTNPWVMMLNNDTVATPTMVAELRAAARAGGPDLGMLQARIVFKDRKHLTNSTGVLLRSDGSAMDRDFEAVVRDGDTTEEIFCASAGAALYRRAMLEQVQLPTGIFDKTYFMYFEDVDLGWRCRLAGWRAAYVPSAVVHHTFNGSSSRHGGRFVGDQCRRNRLCSLVKNASVGFLARSSWRTVADVGELVAANGPREIVKTGRAIAASIRQRACVEAMVRVPRTDIERRWVV